MARYRQESAFGLNSLAKAYSTQPGLFAAIFRWEESTFFERPQDASVFTPLFAHQFERAPSSIRPMTSLAADVFKTGNGQRVPQLAKLGPITRLVWGAQDPDLNLNIANRRAAFRVYWQHVVLVLSQAHHNVAIDAPDQEASAILGS